MKQILSAALLLFAAPAMGGETAWQEVMPGVSIRLIATNAVTDSNSTWIALEFDMPDTVKTYWRVPGESGIPPRLDFAGSSGIGDHEIAWPFPRREETEYYLDHAYYGHTMLPIEVELAQGEPSINLNVILGICSDICVPVSADFALDIDLDSPHRPNIVRMQQARADVPIAWDGDEMIGEVRFIPHEGMLVADMASHAFPHASAIADIEGRPLLFGAPEVDADGSVLRFPLLGKSKADIADGEHVHITFAGEDGPYEIVRPVRISGS